MRLYIIRHGETDWNTAGRLQGQADTQLNEKGIRLAQITAEGMKTIPFDLCITSPLKRARQTAEIILSGRPVPIWEDDRIREIGFGAWEGLGCREGNFQIPVPKEEFDKFYTDPFRFQPDKDGETVEAVCRRTREFLEEITANPDYQDKTILISSHGCASRAILNSVYEEKEDFWHGHVPPNCAVSLAEGAKGHLIVKESDRIYYDPSEIVDFRTGKKREN